MNARAECITIISEKLARVGWEERHGLFDPALLRALANEAHQHELQGHTQRGSTGRMAGRQPTDVRGDSTLWLDDPRCGAAAAAFLEALHVLRGELNESLLMGLATVDAHFAVYPAGAAYARHKDRFRDDDTRMLSLVCYLNADWPKNAGGALRLHLPEGLHDVPPTMGTSVMFLSAEVEHEVLPSLQTRYSIAAWFRRRELGKA